IHVVTVQLLAPEDLGRDLVGLGGSRDQGPRSSPLFQDLARRVESESHLVQHANNLRALTTVMSIPAVDDRLLDEAIARCQSLGGDDATTTWAELGTWAEERLKLTKLGVNVSEDWQVVFNTTRLRAACRNAEETLERLQSPSAEELVS